MLIPMKLKGEAYEALSLLFQHDGAPLDKICDNANETILGKFNRNLKEASCHLRQTELFIPWLNAAKREIKEPKKGSSRNLIKSGTPKRLWDACLELESYISLILHMASTNWMGKSLKLSCPERCPT